MENPRKGWTAFFVELTFDSGIPIPYKFTTQIHVIPGRLPYAYKLGFDDDGDIDFMDLSVFASEWLLTDSPADIWVLCGDGNVDFVDYALLSSEWKSRTQWTTPAAK